MFKIRQGTFETNSSSVHSLSVKKTDKIDANIFNISLTIEPFYNKDFDIHQDLFIFKTLKNKLKYIWTLLIQSRDETSERELFKLFPNVTFIKPENPFDIYYFEDSDWLFYKGSFDVSEVDKWTLEQWKRWFCSGLVIIYSRDTYDRYGDKTLDPEWYIQNKNVQESYKKEQDIENYDSLSWEG